MSDTQHAADEFLADLFEKTFGADDAERMRIILHEINKLSPSYPRLICVRNHGTQYHDGIAPGALGVTSRQKMHRYFKVVEVDRSLVTTEAKPKAKAKRKAKAKTGEAA